MTIMLVLAFLGSLLSMAGKVIVILASSFLDPANSGSGNFFQPIFGYDPATGILTVIVAFLLFLAGCLTLSLYPKRERRQWSAGFLAAIVLTIRYFAYDKRPFPLLEFDPTGKNALFLLGLSIGIAIMVCLLVSGRIKGWLGLTGLGIGLGIGIALSMTKITGFYNFNFSPLWLSAVFFPELLSRRLDWQAALTGGLFWVGLIVLSMFLTGAL
jgi:hypothetical protein